MKDRFTVAGWVRHRASAHGAAGRQLLGRWLVVAAAFVLTACQSAALLDPGGPVGREQRTLMIDSLIIMLAIGIPTIVATLGFAWWYRASNTKARYRPDWNFSGQLEMVVWSIPLMVILLLGGVTWIGSYRLDPAVPLDSKEPPLHVQVVSLDWKWLFIYPEQRVAAVNQLVIPAGVPVRFSLTSASVWNTFFIPKLGSMIYTMNGMQTLLHLKADKPGTFLGFSGHFSGDGFSDMHFQVNAVPAGEFSTWIASARASGRMLDAAAYTTLAKPSAKVPPTTFGGVEADLFGKILSLHLPPGPGPGTGHSHGAGGAAAPTSTHR